MNKIKKLRGGIIKKEKRYSLIIKRKDGGNNTLRGNGT
jgi:hypothetical protein